LDNLKDPIKSGLFFAQLAKRVSISFIKMSIKKGLNEFRPFLVNKMLAYWQ